MADGEIKKPPSWQGLNPAKPVEIFIRDTLRVTRYVNYYALAVALACFINFDLRLAALFLWITLFLANLSR